MGTDETQRDYWRTMRPIGTHETQRDYWRLMETNGNSSDREGRLLETHETNADS